MDTEYQKDTAGSGNADDGGSTRRMDMSDMQDEGMDPLGESSADAVSASEAGTTATAGQGSSDQTQSAAKEMQMSDAIGDDMIGQDGDGAASSGDGSGAAKSSAAGAGAVSSGAGSTQRSRVPDYALETIAEGLRQRGLQVKAADLDAALGEAGFTVNPDPWHNYQPRPSLAEGAIQQRQAQDAGGFVSAAPASSIGSITLPAASEQAAAAPDMGAALSQIQADEAQTVSPTGSAEAALPAPHPEPASGLEVQGEPAGSGTDTAAGAASGMGDVAATEQPSDAGAGAGISDAAATEQPSDAGAGAGISDAAATEQPVTTPSLGFDAPAVGEAISDVGPVQPSVFAARDLPAEDHEAAPIAQPADGAGGAMGSSLSYGEALPVASAGEGEGMQAPVPPISAGMGGTAPMQGEAASTEGASTVAMPPQPVANTMQVGGGVGQLLAPFVALSNGVEFPLGDKSEILIGREDPVSDIFPDIDLTNFGGEEGGVSRRHARIIRDGDTYLLEDLNSTNYTKLNGVKLIPKIPQAMRDGDHVSFGKVEATFHLYK